MIEDIPDHRRVRVAKLDRRYQKKLRTLYGNALEWRFEYPEVLDDDGRFMGFDIVIGNPPYIRADAGEDHLRLRRHLEGCSEYETLWEKWDLYVPFLERGYKLLKPGGLLMMIISDAFCHAKYAQKARTWFLKNSRVLRLDFVNRLDIFESVAVHNVIVLFQKADGADNRLARLGHAPALCDSTAAQAARIESP